MGKAYNEIKKTMVEVLMIRTVIWWIYFVLHLVFTLPSLLYAKLLDKQGKLEVRDIVAVEAARRWARALVKITGSEILIHGEENLPKDQAVLFVGNHQGDFDVPICLGYVDKPAGFIAKIETTKIPVVCSWMRYLYCVFIDRKDIRQSVEAINVGVGYLKNGHSLIIFPEGTRSRGKGLGEFKAGSFKLATKAGVPIVPLTINGSYKIFEERNHIITPSTVHVTFSPKIETKDLTPQEIKELPDRVKRIIQQNLDK